MTAHDRILADAAAQAAASFDLEAELGAQRWATASARGYARQAGPDAVVTVVHRDGTRHRTVIVGGDLASFT